MEDKRGVFNDKTIITIQVLEKEGAFVGVYSNLTQQIHSKELSSPKEILDSNSYYNSWRLLFELYTFLEYNVEEEYEKENKTQERTGFLIDTMERYDLGDTTLTHIELRKCSKVMRKIVFILGYHENAIQTNLMDEQPQNF